MNSNQVSIWIAELGLWPLIVVLVPNLLFRRYGQAAVKKRMASLYHGIIVFIIMILALSIVERELSDIYLYIGIIVVVLLLLIFRKNIFPYRLNCPDCSNRLDFRTIYFMDDSLCANCRTAKKEREEAESIPEDLE